MNDNLQVKIMQSRTCYRYKLIPSSLWKNLWRKTSKVNNVFIIHGRVYQRYQCTKKFLFPLLLSYYYAFLDHQSLFQNLKILCFRGKIICCNAIQIYLQLCLPLNVFLTVVCQQIEDTENKIKCMHYKW